MLTTRAETSAPQRTGGRGQTGPDPGLGRQRRPRLAAFARRAAPALLALSLGACVDALAQRRAFLGSLVGHPEADAVRALGVPTRSIEAGGHRFLSWDDRRLDILPGIYPTIGWWGPAGYGLGGFPPVVTERGCDTTVEVAEGRIIGYSLRGNGCS